MFDALHSIKNKIIEQLNLLLTGPFKFPYQCSFFGVYGQALRLLFYTFRKVFPSIMSVYMLSIIFFKILDVNTVISSFLFKDVNTLGYRITNYFIFLSISIMMVSFLLYTVIDAANNKLIHATSHKHNMVRIGNKSVNLMLLALLFATVTAFVDYFYIIVLYFIVRWFFTLNLILFQNYSFFSALRQSNKLLLKNWFETCFQGCFIVFSSYMVVGFIDIILEPLGLDYKRIAFILLVNIVSYSYFPCVYLIMFNDRSVRLIMYKKEQEKEKLTDNSIA